MRKLLYVAFCIFTLLISSTVYSQSNINIYIDNEQKVFEPGPIVQNDSTLVPMRALFENLGAKVYWYDTSRTIIAIRDSYKIKLKIGSNEGFVNNNKIILSAAPQIISEKTYVPLRFISEALGAQVNWDGSTRTITIKDKTKVVSKVPALVDSNKYEIRTIYNFINDGDEANFNITIQAVGALSDSPYQQDENMVIYPEPYESSTDEYGNRSSRIKFDNVKAGEKFSIIVTKKLVNSGIKYIIDKNNISNDYSMLNNYSIYTSPQLLIESNNEKIIKKADEITENEKNPYQIAKKIYEFVNLYLTYDLSEEYIGKGALNALETKRGVCQEYSSLFTALMRSKGIPTRTAYGYWIQEDYKNDIKSEWYNTKELMHEWPEFYLPEYGWIIVEPTYNYTMNGVPAVPWDQFANQNIHGHIIDTYSSNNQRGIEYNIRGYGKLSIKVGEKKTEIRKIN